MGPMPGGGGHGSGKRQAAKGKKKSSSSRSGNPAKRAAENAAIASGAPVGQGSTPSGAGFGLVGGGAAKPAPSEEELAALQKLLGG